MPEPLLAIYHPKDIEALKIRFKQGEHSLRYFLSETQAIRLEPIDSKGLKSFDTPEDFAAFTEPTNA
jgi:molybdopterin-guanine dinucleotide biosynthesis protein A